MPTYVYIHMYRYIKLIKKTQYFKVLVVAIEVTSAHFKIS